MSEPYVGEIALFAFPRAPVGWYLCDGSRLRIADDNEILFSIIGTTYGGDGVETFCVPDLRGRVPVHTGQAAGLSARPLGAVGGSETVSLQAVHAPPHSHVLSVSTDAANKGTPEGNLLAAAANKDNLYVTPEGIKDQVARSTKAMTTSFGGGQPHENIMPTIALTYCICKNGVYPSRA